jgi:hypothetical protein
MPATPPQTDEAAPLARRLLRMVLLPSGFYLAGFAVLTYPALWRFSTHYFADRNDGLLNVWRMWWVREALFRLRESPWYTTYIHHPYGLTLLGDDLAPLNGVLASLLSPWLTLVEAHNAIVVLAFVTSGLFTFLLCYHFTHAWGPSLWGGYLFTFSQYHFAHAQGHLSLVSTQWIPLFALTWSVFLRTGRTAPALGAALSLALVVYSNYYYFVYCLFLLALLTAWHAVRRRDGLFLLRQPFPRSLAVFALTAAATVAPLAVAFLRANAADPFLGTQNRSQFSLDLLAPLVPGGHWRFAEATRPYWSALPGNINESSVSLGFALVVLCIYAWRHRRAFPDPDVRFWFVPLVLFLVLALGPSLLVWGRPVPLPLPHLWLEKLVPPLRLSSTPVRMIVLCTLSVSVVAAAGLQQLWSAGARGRAFAAVLVATAVFETLPRPLPLTRVDVPAYARALASAPGPGAVLDLFTPPNLAVYLQMVHHRPLVFGRVSRVPASVERKDAEVRELVERGQYSRLFWEYGVRFVVTAVDRPVPGARLLLLDASAGAAVYDLAGRRVMGGG